MRVYFFFSQPLISHVFFIISFFTAWPLRLVQGRNDTANSRRQQNGRRDVQGIHRVTSGPRWLSICVTLAIFLGACFIDDRSSILCPRFLSQLTLFLFFLSLSLLREFSPQRKFSILYVLLWSFSFLSVSVSLSLSLSLCPSALN